MKKKPLKWWRFNPFLFAARATDFTIHIYRVKNTDNWFLAIYPADKHTVVLVLPDELQEYYPSPRVAAQMCELLWQNYEEVE